MVKGPRTLLIALAPALVWLSAVAPLAQAHPEPSPTLVNRYVTLAPAEAKLGVQLTLLYGDLPAGELRRQMDADHDGTISPAELAAERRTWLDRQASATPLLALRLDGRPIALASSLKIDLGGDSGTGPQPLLIEVVASHAIDPGEHRLEVVLGPDLPRMGETELMLDASDPWILRATLDAEGRPLELQPLVRYPAPRADGAEKRGGTFVVRADGPVGARAKRPQLAVPIALVTLATVLGVVLTLLVRRIDRRSAQDRGAPGGPPR